MKSSSFSADSPCESMKAIPFPGLDIRHRHIFKKRAFAYASFSNHVNMAPAIVKLNAKFLILVTSVIMKSERRDIFIYRSWAMYLNFRLFYSEATREGSPFRESTFSSSVVETTPSGK